MSRWFQIFLIATLGIALGLLYGWVIAPVEYIDTTPDTLHPQYRADYALMVAESYQSDENLDLAARRLALLGSAHPAEIAAETLDYAQSNDFPTTDLEKLENLIRDLTPWQPTLGDSTQ